LAGVTAPGFYSVLLSSAAFCVVCGGTTNLLPCNLLSSTNTIEYAYPKQACRVGRTFTTKTAGWHHLPGGRALPGHSPGDNYATPPPGCALKRMTDGGMPVRRKTPRRFYLPHHHRLTLVPPSASDGGRNCCGTRCGCSEHFLRMLSTHKHRLLKHILCAGDGCQHGATGFLSADYRTLRCQPLKLQPSLTSAVEKRFGSRDVNRLVQFH